MIDVKPTHNVKQDCFDDVIATVASYYKQDYQMMLINTWGFGFAPPDNIGKVEIGLHLDTKSRVNLFNLEKYHGIKIFYNDKKDFHTAIKKMNEGNTFQRETGMHTH